MAFQAIYQSRSSLDSENKKIEYEIEGKSKLCTPVPLFCHEVEGELGVWLKVGSGHMLIDPIELFNTFFGVEERLYVYDCENEGKSFEDYIHDMGLCQRFAELNRKAMIRVITEGMGLKPKAVWQTIHNYIDIENMILRKGAISARKGERVLIPMNMRDGSLICIGKGNPDWNYSAPHGAGRLMSRADAFKRIQMEDFQNDCNRHRLLVSL